MTPRLSFVYPFYTNPVMLRDIQYPTWAGYPDDLKAQIEVVLVDDGSPDAAIDVPRPDGLPALRIYRVLEDRLWHQHAARNLGATESVADWLFMTDMDHVLPAESLKKLLNRLDGDQVYGFFRVDAPHLKPKLLNGRHHPHQNTFAVRKARYWAAGGYDEDFCGIYGTDGYFLRRLLRHQAVTQLNDIQVIRYSRDVVHDASTRADRESYRNHHRRRHLLAMKDGMAKPTAVLQFPWRREL